MSTELRADGRLTGKAEWSLGPHAGCVCDDGIEDRDQLAVVLSFRRAATMDRDASDLSDTVARLALIRDETRFEIGLLHDRVNALVGAEAFLTIAYTAAMSNGAPWGAEFSHIVSPILSVLGLLLALLAWPGVETTVKLVLQWTARQTDLLSAHPELAATAWALTVRGRGGSRTDPDQRRSMLFFRTVPVLFTVVWTALTVIALTLHR